jgi:hypothetical protein
MGGNTRTRDILLLLRTDLGDSRPAAFSQGVRQTLATLAREGRWRDEHRIWIGTEAELEGDHSVLLSRSRFCLVVPRDGWPGLFEDAVLHGCIPVVVSGGTTGAVAQPFSAVLRLSAAVLKVRPEELPNLPAILGGITEQQEETFRRNLARWWHRMAWLSHPWVREQAAGLVEENMRKSPRIKDELEQQQLKQQQVLSQMGRKRASSSSSSSSSDVGASADANNALAASVASKEHEYAAQASTLLELRVWQPHVAADDAFTTLMQWLHHKMLHPYNPASSRVSGRQHARPDKGPAVTTERRQS